MDRDPVQFEGWSGVAQQQAASLEHASRSQMAATFMNQVFGWMAGGLAVSGGVAWWVTGSQGALQAVAGLFMPLIIAEFLLVAGERVEKLAEGDDVVAEAAGAAAALGGEIARHADFADVAIGKQVMPAVEIHTAILSRLLHYTSAKAWCGVQIVRGGN